MLRNLDLKAALQIFGLQIPGLGSVGLLGRLEFMVKLGFRVYGLGFGVWVLRVWRFFWFRGFQATLAYGASSASGLELKI